MVNKEFEPTHEEEMILSVRPGSMVPVHYVLTLSDEEREAYKFVKLVEQAIEMVFLRRKISTKMNHEQFERVVVVAARLFGHQSPLMRYDDKGNCPAVTMVLSHHLQSSKTAMVNLNSLNKEFTFVKAFPARELLLESVSQALDDSENGRKPPK